MNPPTSQLPRITQRMFLQKTAMAGAALAAAPALWTADPASAPATTQLNASDLPKGPAPEPVPLPHFADRLQAFVWRNWTLVPIKRMAHTVGVKPEQLLALGRSMGLAGPPQITADQQRRSAITVIRRNWHLLPYEQLLDLLGWTAEQMAFSLREDDFLFVKLGDLKPHCEPLRYSPPTEESIRRAHRTAAIIQEEFHDRVGLAKEPLFDFIRQLSRKPARRPRSRSSEPQVFGPRFCYSYFALYGDPLLQTDLNPYPDGYLARLSTADVNGVWLQCLLQKLAPFPWDTTLSSHYRDRLANLKHLVRRAARYGIGVYLYLNEPRSMPLAFFENHPQFKGVVEGEFATLCSSHPAIQQYIVQAVASICRAVPQLAGFFTISGSENLTNCWSHGNGAACPRCRQRAPAAVISELNNLIHQGIRQAGAKTELIAWDWGWADDWIPGIIDALQPGIGVMSVSEWSIPIERGGVKTTVGEYSISTIGPGPRATRTWDLARKRGLKTIAKIQAGNTWELSAVPYIPALENVARHILNLRKTGVDGLMLGWTLGGYPSPNLEVVGQLAEQLPENVTAELIMFTVAQNRFGPTLAPAIVQAWCQFSAAFSLFPFHGALVYTAPMQFGPSNLLWSKPTRYRATMIGFPYDDIDTWRAVYPPEVFAAQFKRIAQQFDLALDQLQRTALPLLNALSAAQRQAFLSETNVAETAAIHFRSTANQARFVIARQKLNAAHTQTQAAPLALEIETILRNEIDLARRLYAIQSRDSRIGFEATNQYYYVPVDLAEKVLNCRYLLDHWLPTAAAKTNT